MKKILLSIFILIFLTIISKHIWITNTVWEYDRGFKIGEGDFIEFSKKMYSLKLNTIYRKGVKNSKVIKFNFLNGEIWLQDIKSKNIGVYIDRDNH